SRNTRSPAKGAGGPRVPRTARQKATSAPRRGMERTITVGRCCGARSCWKSWRPVDDLRKTSATWVGPVATRRADAAADAPPAREALQQQARRCRQILKTSLVDFFLPACVDKVHGGYLESLRQGKFAPTGEKFLTQQGRQLWFFSTLAREGVEEKAA